MEAASACEVLQVGDLEIRAGDGLVDGLDREAPLLLEAPDLADRGDEHAIDHEAGHLAAADRDLAERLGEARRGRDGLGRAGASTPSMVTSWECWVA